MIEFKASLIRTRESSKLCNVVGCKTAWVSCVGCVMYEEDAQIAEQVAAILLGLTDA